MDLMMRTAVQKPRQTVMGWNSDDVDLCVSEPNPSISILMKMAVPIRLPHWSIPYDQISTQKIQFARAKSTILPVSYPILDQVARHGLPGHQDPC